MLERFVERALYQSRWLLAPIYFGMIGILLVLTYKFYQELFHLFMATPFWSESKIVLSILSLIDLALIGNLVLMVLFSGYENSVSKIDIDHPREEKLDWMGKMNAGAVKQKVSASIIAISSIHLLKVFMNLDSLETEKVLLYTAIHVVFVLSAIGLAIADKIAHK